MKRISVFITAVAAFSFMLVNSVLGPATNAQDDQQSASTAKTASDQSVADQKQPGGTPQDFPPQKERPATSVGRGVLGGNAQDGRGAGMPPGSGIGAGISPKIGGGMQFMGGASRAGGFPDDSAAKERVVEGSRLMIVWSEAKDQLRGFSMETGKWSTLNVAPQKQIVPYVRDACGAVKLSDGIAAYSATNGQWDVLSLPQKSQASPQLTSDLVTVFEGEHVYTFAASLGKWTSPTDPSVQEVEVVLLGRDLNTAEGRSKFQLRMQNSRMSSMTNRYGTKVRGNARDVDQLLLWVKKTFPDMKTKDYRRADASVSAPVIGLSTTNRLEGAVGGASIKGVNADRNSSGSADLKALELAKTLRDKSDVSDKERSELQQLVQSALKQRLDSQVKLAEQLRAKLQAVESKLQNRQSNQQKIIDRRVEELLNPDLDWDSVSANSLSSGYAAVRPTKNQSYVQSLGMSAAPGSLTGAIARSPFITRSLPRTEASTNRLGTRESEDRKLFDHLAAATSLVSDVDSAQRELAKIAVGDSPSGQREMFELARRQRLRQLDYVLDSWKSAFRKYEMTCQDLEQQISLSKKELSLAKDSADRAKTLAKEGLFSESQMKTKELELERKTYALEKLERRLNELQKILDATPELDPSKFALPKGTKKNKEVSTAAESQDSGPKTSNAGSKLSRGGIISNLTSGSDRMVETLTRKMEETQARRKLYEEVINKLSQLEDREEAKEVTSLLREAEAKLRQELQADLKDWEKSFQRFQSMETQASMLRERYAKRLEEAEQDYTRANRLFELGSGSEETLSYLKDVLTKAKASNDNAVVWAEAIETLLKETSELDPSTFELPDGWDQGSKEETKPNDNRRSSRR